MFSKGVLLLLALASAGIVWFLFIKEYDYRFHLTTRYGPGVAFEEISDLDSYEVFPNEILVNREKSNLFKNLVQEIKIGERQVMELNWKLEPENDSLTHVYLYIRSEKNKLANRLAILNPFGTSHYIDSITLAIKSFKHTLDVKQDSYKIRLEDEIIQSPALDCICRTAREVPVDEKANRMVTDIAYLESYMLDKELKLTGSPFVKVSRWNKKQDLIDFDFCFPVNLAQDIRPDSRVDFKQVPAYASLKAVYNGNYRNSHLAWYELLFKAENSGVQTSALPLELFHNNPKQETDALQWKAEVYLPVAPVE